MRALTLIVAGSLLAAALFTPWVYALVLEIWPDPPWPFRRVFNRVAMLALLVIVVRQRKRMGLSRVGQIWRLESWRQRGTAVGLGAALSFGSGLALAPIMLGMGALERSGMSASALAGKLPGDLAGGVLVGLIEEAFFRILVLEAMRRVLGTWGAVLGSSAFYAALHFLRPDRSFVWDGFSFGIGFRYLSSIVGGMFAPQNAAAFVGLALIGVVLALARLRTDSFGLCIGLHAGWFVVRKLVLRGTAMPDEIRQAGGGKFEEISWHLLGLPATWISIAMVGWAVYALAPRFDRRSRANLVMSPGS